MNDHVSQIVDAALHVLEPDRRPCESVRGHDVEHQEAVDVHDGGLLVEVAGQQVGVSWIGAAIPADIEVVAALRGDEAEVLAPRLGTFTHTPGNRRFELVRRPDPPIALLDPNGELDRILYAVPTPRRPDAALDGPQRLAVGMTALETGANQLLPDVGQLVHLRAEHVDPLSTGDLREETVFLGDRAERDELVRGDFAARDARNHGVDAAALHIRQEAVVGVLERLMLIQLDVLVPQTREHRADGRLAGLASVAASNRRDECVEGLDLLDLDGIEQLLPGVGEVFAQIGVDGSARCLQLLLEKTRHERQTAAAAGARLREGFHVADDREVVVPNRTADVALVDAVALTHLGVVRHLRGGDDDTAAVRAEHQCPRFGRQLGLVLREHHETAVVGRVTDQNAAK